VGDVFDGAAGVGFDENGVVGDAELQGVFAVVDGFASGERSMVVGALAPVNTIRGNTPWW
jgi:hypothetical protein